MLPGTAIAAPPFFAPFVLMSAATASHTSALRLETTTRAPSAAICSAMNLPMPLVEPVMTATLPDRSNIGGMSLMRFLACVFVRRSEEHTSELQSLMRISYAVFCLKKKQHKKMQTHNR